MLQCFLVNRYKYGQWERVRLYPAQVDILIVKCDLCGGVYRVYPSFFIGGTTLALSALIFVAFVYEYSKLVWRDMPEKFCDEHNRIAHSTIYRAVHGLGKAIADSDNRLNDACYFRTGVKFSTESRLKQQQASYKPATSVDGRGLFSKR